MKVQALTITAPRIAQSIRIPVIISQSNALCQRFGLDQIEVDVYALLDTGATNTATMLRSLNKMMILFKP
jgi:hypothetical protein